PPIPLSPGRCTLSAGIGQDNGKKKPPARNAKEPIPGYFTSVSRLMPTISSFLDITPSLFFIVI
ncbi:hypothetical protein, partial [Escherichia coli]|uniref:hypothetical protein n=1 Tax=Escherichia coli TaxID=562 RepID=UPI002B24E22B